MSIIVIFLALSLYVFKTFIFIVQYKIYKVTMKVEANNKYVFFSSITKAILSAQQLGINNDIKIPGSSVTVQSTGTPAQLMRLRRQFLTYSKMQQSGINQIAALFVQYLNKNL